MADEVDEAALRHLKGFGGWLFVFAATLVVGLIQDAVLLISSRSVLMGSIVVGLITLTVYGFSLLSSEDNRAPQFWTITLAVMACLGLVFGDLATVARSLIWLLYWSRSKRVLITFGATGLGGRFGIGRRLRGEQEATA